MTEETQKDDTRGPIAESSQMAADRKKEEGELVPCNWCVKANKAAECDRRE